METVLIELVDVLVPIAGCVMIAALVLVPMHLRSVERRKLAETVRAAIDKGQPLPPEVIMTLSASQKPGDLPERDLRRGLLLVAVALGMMGLGFALGASRGEPLYPLIGSAAFPGFIGAALIVTSYLNKSRS